ncbi:MAG: cation:proton antiporter [Planctomycetota bacterium]
MEEAFRTAALWLALAVLATILANHLRVSMALIEICIGIAAGTLAARFFGPDSLGAHVDWLRFLAATGAVVLTFLAGAELEPAVLRAKWKEVTVVWALSASPPPSWAARPSPGTP